MMWYERPMRIAALQCSYEDGKNLAVIDRWAVMGFNTEQLSHPMADGCSALFDRERHGDLLARCLAKGHRAGRGGAPSKHLRPIATGARSRYHRAP